MESMQLALENVVSAVYDGSTEYDRVDSEIQLSLGIIFEGFPLTSSYIIKNIRFSSYAENFDYC